MVKKETRRCALIDLHLHLDGSLSPDTICHLATEQGVSLKAGWKNRLCAEKQSRDLNEYLEKFDFYISLLQTKDALEYATAALAEDLRKQGLQYAEIRFAPQKHTKKGLSQKDAVAAAVRGLSKSKLPGNLILCCMRGEDNRDENEETVSVAADFLGHGVCAADLAGAEALYPTTAFSGLFSLMRDKKVPFTIHAGEADGPQSVAAALNAGAARIGHGVRAAEDARLVSRLAQSGVTLELCATSNLNTGVFSSIAQFPLRQFLEAGVCVTVNTDNMTVSKTTLEREFSLLKEAFTLTEDETNRLCLNAVQASFLPETEKASLRLQLKNKTFVC